MSRVQVVLVGEPLQHKTCVLLEEKLKESSITLVDKTGVYPSDKSLLNPPSWFNFCKNFFYTPPMPTQRLTVWNIGNFNQLVKKCPHINEFQTLFESELLVPPAVCDNSLVLLYDTTYSPTHDMYLDIVQDMSIQFKMHLLHIPCNVTNRIVDLSQKDPHQPFNFSDNQSTIHPALPHAYRYWKKVGNKR